MNLQIYEISQNLLRVMLSNKNVINQQQLVKYLTLEFDPGSGRTLAACLKHASRTELVRVLVLEPT